MNTNPHKIQTSFSLRISQQNLSNSLEGISIGGLAVIAKDGVDSVRTAVRELEKYGYLVCSQQRENKNMIATNSEMDMQEVRGYYCDVIRANISYDFFYENRYSTKLKINMCRINEIVAIMIDMVCSKQKAIRVNGEDLPKETVKKRFLELDDTHIEYVMTALDRSKSEVRNIRAYLITALYNAPMTMDTWVKHDLYGM